MSAPGDFGIALTCAAAAGEPREAEAWEQVARGNRDVVGFRRIFVLFCTLVLLPAMLLSGFGVVAISNERSATKQRQREQALGELRDAESRIIALIDRTADAMASLQPQNLPTGTERLRKAELAVGAVALLPLSGPPEYAEAPLDRPDVLPELERAQVIGAELPPGGLAHLSLSSVSVAGVLAIQRTDDDALVTYLLDEERLTGAATLPGAPNGRQIEVGISDEELGAVVGPLDRWMKDFVRAEGEGSLPTIAELRLRAPFERYTLRVVGPEPGRTTVIVYIILLVIFYAILITGVVITSRLIWQETRLSRLKTDFVSHVSHELRTPLTSIRMFIETLRLGRATSPEEQEECLELLGRETERLSEMIERVLGYARLRSGRRVFNPSEVTAQELIDDSLAAFRAQTLGEPNVKMEIVTEIEDGLPPLLVDRLALVEALLNLIGNAYKYTGEEKRIRVFARHGKRRVEIGVEDNGPGLAKSEHGRIFDRFYQAGADLLSRSQKGSGLGLAITKGIVEGNRGKIHVESEEGRGATFILELRPARRHRAPSPQPAPHATG